MRSLKSSLFCQPITTSHSPVLPNLGLLLASLPPVWSHSPSPSCQRELPSAHLIVLFLHAKACNGSLLPA